MLEFVLFKILKPIFSLLLEMNIGSKYQLSASLTTNNQYRYRPWKNHIGLSLPYTQCLRSISGAVVCLAYKNHYVTYLQTEVIWKLTVHIHLYSNTSCYYEFLFDNTCLICTFIVNWLDLCFGNRHFQTIPQKPGVAVGFCSNQWRANSLTNQDWDQLIKWVKSGVLLLGWKKKKTCSHTGPLWNSLDMPVLKVPGSSPEQ